MCLLPDGLNLPTVIIPGKIGLLLSLDAWKSSSQQKDIVCTSVCMCGAKLMSKSMLFIVSRLGLGTRGHGQGNIRACLTQLFVLRAVTWILPQIAPFYLRHTFAGWTSILVPSWLKSLTCWTSYIVSGVYHCEYTLLITPMGKFVPLSNPVRKWKFLTNVNWSREERGVDTLHLVCFWTCDAIDVEKATSEAVLVDVRICCLCWIGCNLVHMPRWKKKLQQPLTH